MAIEPKIDRFQNEQSQSKPLPKAGEAEPDVLADAPVFTMESSLWKLFGAVSIEGPTDISTNKRNYLDERDRPKRDQK